MAVRAPVPNKKRMAESPRKKKLLAGGLEWRPEIAKPSARGSATGPARAGGGGPAGGEEARGVGPEEEERRLWPAELWSAEEEEEGRPEERRRGASAPRRSDATGHGHATTPSLGRWETGDSSAAPPAQLDLGGLCLRHCSAQSAELLQASTLQVT
uniref:PH01B015M02.6 protein n=1 Tax=Phyllostachys edulis TaxID=38705 RepID=L0P251_PHYED|nr:PH01B015M02.6 [Phyllostachys edulis]